MRVEDFLEEFKRIVPEYKWYLSEKRILGKQNIGFSFSPRYVIVCPFVAHWRKCCNTEICDLAYQIISSADGREGCDAEVRKKLLEICGLGETC